MESRRRKKHGYGGVFVEGRTTTASYTWGQTARTTLRLRQLRLPEQPSSHQGLTPGKISVRLSSLTGLMFCQSKKSDRVSRAQGGSRCNPVPGTNQGLLDQTRTQHGAPCRAPEPGFHATRDRDAGGSRGLFSQTRPWDAQGEELPRWCRSLAIAFDLPHTPVRQTSKPQIQPLGGLIGRRELLVDFRSVTQVASQ